MRDGSFGDEILEIAKVAYHSTGYAGFPVGNMACKLARDVFDAQT